MRETFGPEVDRALDALRFAGVPGDAVATIRARLRRDKRVVAAAIRLCEVMPWGLDPVAYGAAWMAAAGELLEVVGALQAREGARR